ncbi:hypothetical protein HDU67_002930 [Dinochytrium kinnereticum]|nr:hypothetical protein HDU67_002930 [Dinochytrium kinnereticum]
MGGNVSVETHLTVKDIYSLTLQTGLSVAEVEYLFRRYRSLNLASASSVSPFQNDEADTLAAGHPPLAGSNDDADVPSPTKQARGGSSLAVDADYGYPIFVEQLRNDWLLSRTVKFMDYLDAVVAWKKKSTEERLQFLFKLIDYDSDGSISASDVSVILQQMQHTQFSLGDRVRIRNDSRTGVLRYFGETRFAPGVWAGLELDEAVGKHDGSVQGIRYFSCEGSRGIFVQYHTIELLEHYQQALEVISLFGADESDGRIFEPQFVAQLKGDSFAQELLASVSLF